MNARCSRCDFSKADLTDAVFKGADCRGARFENAILFKADFRGAQLDRAEFNYSDCRGARFNFAKLPYSVFSHAALNIADFSGADLTQSVLHRISDQGTNWTGSIRTLAEYTDRDLAEAEDWKPPVQKEL